MLRLQLNNSYRKGFSPKGDLFGGACMVEW